MSERITKSMYATYPFEKAAKLNQPGWFQRKINRVKGIRERRFYDSLKRRLTRDCIADVKVDFTKLSRYTADSFPESGPLPWTDRPTFAQDLARMKAEGKISAETSKLIEHYAEDGYVVLEKFFSDNVLDEVWANYERLVYDGKVPVETYQKESGDLYLGRCLNPHFQVPKLKVLTHDKRLVDLISIFMGVRAIPFQTITGFAGSQQLPHSDAIHMTTYPPGYLSAAWIAFEDIHPDSGPLVYFPGSHKLPYLMSHHLEDDEVDLAYKRNRWYNDVYEKEIQRLITEHNLQPKYFSCRKGDVLVWHANLIHGGSPRNDMSLSRKALVSHYFGENTFCYGDRNEIMVNPYQG